MANRFLSNIRINDAYTLPASDGTNGQAIVTDGAGNLSFGDVASGAGGAAAIYRDNFTGNGTTVAFTLDQSLTSDDQAFVYIDGVYQEKSTYSITGRTITFTTAPATGDSIEIIYILGIDARPTSLYQDNFTGNGSTTNFTLANAVIDEKGTFVYLNGVYQFKGTYSVSGTTLSFDTAPANGVAIEVISITNVNFGGDFSVDSLQFLGGTGSQGTVSWNSDEETLDVIQNGAVLQVGQELHVHVRNNTGSTILNGTPVYVTGTLGASGRLTVAPMVADGSIDAKYFIGVTTEDIANDTDGKVTWFGKVRNFNTTTYTEGQTLYVGTAGGWTTTPPQSPALDLEVAVVISSKVDGTIFVRGNTGSYLGMLHDVRLNSPASGDLLVYNVSGSESYWQNQNSLPSLNVTGNLTVDTNTLFVDAANNRVGIGTSSPDSNLVVNGSSNVRVNLKAGDVRYGTIFADSGVLALASITSIPLVLGTNDTERMRIDSSGKVGINYIPTAQLDVSSGATNIAAAFRSTDAGAYVGFADNNTTLDAGYPTLLVGAISNDMVFYTSNAERMRIDSSGNVGIGTNSPQQLLSIQNTASNAYLHCVSGTSNLGGVWVGDSDANYVGGFLYDNGTNSSYFYTNGSERMRIDSVGQLFCSNDNLVLTYAGTDAIVATNGNKNMLFYTNGSERMRITSGGYVILNSIVYGNTVSSSPRTLYIDTVGGLGGISSIRASKTNIQDVNDVNWIYDLSPVEFNYRKTDEEGNYTDEFYEDKNFGLIAEDTEPIADFLINYNEDENGVKEMKGIEYSRLITPMLKAIQELKAEIELLKSQING